jgi:hypothetical protein
LKRHLKSQPPAASPINEVAIVKLTNLKKTKPASVEALEATSVCIHSRGDHSLPGLVDTLKGTLEAHL